MDNNYFYIFGIFGILLVSFVVFYLFKTNKTVEKMNNQQIEKHIEEDHNVSYVGDKCTASTKYDRCHEEKCIF